MLAVGDGQHVYWETCGNPAGKPAVVLHGGPGSGCTVGMRRSFDPRAYRIVLLDQRGAGRSTPRVTTDTDLSTNTTDHLIADLERLRTHLGIERWLVWGASWGTTLALAYAERHPERVSELVLASITLTRPSDIHWLYHETGRFFPEQWERFREGVPEQERDGDLVASYYRLLNEDPDPEVRRRAARLLVRLGGRSALARSPAGRRASAGRTPHSESRSRESWRTTSTTVPGSGTTSSCKRPTASPGIPGVLVHGRMDLGGPADAAWQLARAWPDAELHLVNEGHGGGDEMMALLIEATDRFALQP